MSEEMPSGSRASPTRAPGASSAGVPHREDAVAMHLEARAAFLLRGDVELAHGASVLAAVAALRIASSRSSSAFSHAVKVRRLRSALSGLDQAEQHRLAAMMDAALAREADDRLAAGLPPHGGRLRGRLNCVPVEGREPVPTLTVVEAAIPYPSADAVARYAEAAVAADIDVVQSTAVRVLCDILDRLTRGIDAENAFDALQHVALALCAQTATSLAEADEARRTIVILMLALRRRRPLVAAMLRAKLLLDRRRAGPVLP